MINEMKKTLNLSEGKKEKKPRARKMRREFSIKHLVQLDLLCAKKRKDPPTIESRVSVFFASPGTTINWLKFLR